MIRWWLAAAFAALAATGAAAQDRPARAPRLPLDGVVTNPDWERRPTGEEMARYYPQLAQTFQLSGNAVLQCTVAVGGEVQGCRAVSESPAGLGFGLAAVRLSSVFRMKPRMVDGAPVGGATVNIPIAFRLSPDGGAPPLPPLTAAASVAPTPQALALGRRLVAARRLADGYAATFQRLEAEVGAAAASAPTPADRTAAAKLSAVLQRAVVEHRQQALEEQAVAYASRLSVDQLTQIVAFYESPVGRAWTEAMTPAEQDVVRRTALAVTRAAGEAFCAEAACPDGPPAGPRTAATEPTALPLER